MTLTDIRAAAFADAKRKALEMAKTYIRSKTIVEDFTVKYDVIWSEGEGAVSVLDQKVYKIPDQGDLFSLTVSPPNGEDHIVVYASEVPLGQVNLRQLGQGLARYQGTRSALSTTTRGIVAAAAAPGNDAGAEFYKASWKIETGE